jgi:hypothetical protein
MKGEGNAMIKNAVESLAQIVHRFRFEPFASMIQPIIEEVLAEHKKEKYRKGTILTPILTIYLVFALAIRRDLNYHQTLKAHTFFPGAKSQWRTGCQPGTAAALCLFSEHCG